MASWPEGIIDLGAGQPDFPTPSHIKEAGKRAIDENYTKYTPQPGFDDLREAIARKFQVENGLRVSPEQVVVSCGAKYSLFQVLQCIVKPGDEILILSPHWSAYPMQVTLAGGVPIILPTPEEQRFHPVIDAIRAAATGAAKAIVINSPCNPTGAVYGREVLAELADLAVNRDLIVIADEVYEKMVYDGARHLSIGSLNDEIASRTVTVNSVSKTHSMTGWRIGYAALPGELAEEVTELQSFSTSGPCAIAQRAALAALTNDSCHAETMVTEYAVRRTYLLDRLARIPQLSCCPPEGTFYLFLNISATCGRKIGDRLISGSADFADMLLEEVGVKVIAGEGFGSARHVRVSFAASMAALEEGMDRIERLLG